MTKYKDKFRIESARIPGYDYSQPNWYYVTINTKDHKVWFGEVINEKMVLNDYGKLVKDCWYDIPNHFSNVETDYFVIMPNHIHGIISINDLTCRDVACNVSTDSNKYSIISPKPGSLSVIIRSFKSAVTRRIHEIGETGFIWQPRFYDRVIRNEKELYKIRKYIDLNPWKWVLEKNIDENLNILF